MAFESTLDAIPAVAGLNGQPRKRPGKLHADKGYDFARCRHYLRKRGIKARIARRGVESKEKLGRHRWVVERTHAWFAGFGKLRIRFERRLDIHVALLSLAAAVICSRDYAVPVCSARCSPMRCGRAQRQGSAKPRRVVRSCSSDSYSTYW
jgi:hypothetical protein